MGPMLSKAVAALCLNQIHNLDYANDLVIGRGKHAAKKNSLVTESQDRLPEKLLNPNNHY